MTRWKVVGNIGPRIRHEADYENIETRLKTAAKSVGLGSLCTNLQTDFNPFKHTHSYDFGFIVGPYRKAQKLAKVINNTLDGYTAKVQPG